MNDQNTISTQQQKAVKGILQKIEPLRKEAEALAKGTIENASASFDDNTSNFTPSNLSKSELLNILDSMKTRLQVIYNVYILESKFSNHHEQLIVDLEQHIEEAYSKIKILS